MGIGASIASDRDTFVADWDDLATLTHGGSTSASFGGLFENEYAVLEGVDVSSVSPAFVARTEDVSSAVKGDALTVTVLLLHRVGDVLDRCALRGHVGDQQRVGGGGGGGGGAVGCIRQPVPAVQPGLSAAL